MKPLSEVKHGLLVIQIQIQAVWLTFWICMRPGNFTTNFFLYDFFQAIWIQLINIFALTFISHFNLLIPVGYFQNQYIFEYTLT